MKILPFDRADRDDVLRLHQDTFGKMNLGRSLSGVCRQIESLEKDCAKLVCGDERVKGYAAAYPVGGDSLRLNLIVDPHHARRGIGTALLNEIEFRARDVGARQLEARVIEGMNGSLAFALSRGFVELHRMRWCSLRAADFSFGKWAALGEKLRAQGLTVTTFEAEETAGEDPLEKLVGLQRRAAEGWPLTYLSDEPDVSDVRLRRSFSHITIPDRVAIMKHGGKYVAYTSAERENMLGTAVHPEYRGRGVATYLKAVNIKTLVDGGTTYFESSSANPAMLKVNEKLGYRLNGVAEVRLGKSL